MNSIAEYILDRTGVSRWTQNAPPMAQRETELLVTVLIETCATLGAKTGMA